MPEPGINKNSRLISAVAIGPLSVIPAMLLAISVLRLFYPDAQAGLLRQYHSGLVVSFFGLFVSYGFTLLYGVPAYWLLNRLGQYRLFTIILASLLPALLFSLFNREQWPYYLGMAYFSMFVAAVCWLISVKEK
jgi:hypothetical protein